VVLAAGALAIARTPDTRVSPDARVEQAFVYGVAAGQAHNPIRSQIASESVDNVEKAGLTLVEPVDNFGRRVVRALSALLLSAALDTFDRAPSLTA